MKCKNDKVNGKAIVWKDRWRSWERGKCTWQGEGSRGLDEMRVKCLQDEGNKKDIF